MKIRVLVIDDDKKVRESIKSGLTISKRAIDSANLTRKKLSLFGKFSEIKESPFLPNEVFDLTLQESGEKGMESVRESVETKDPFQLIFIDIRMPAMSGDECARQIRKLDTKVGICFITGYSDKNASLLVKKVGGDLDKILFLKKPFEYDEIRQIARAFNAKWHAERKSEGFQNSLRCLMNSILQLKDTPLKELRRLLEILLYQILGFIDVDSGFIASISKSGKLVFEVGAGKFDSSEDILDIELPTDFIKNVNTSQDFVIKKYKRHQDNAMILMTAAQYQRVIVIEDKERVIEENRNFIKIFTENASVALVNAGLIQELKTAKESLETKVKVRSSELKIANKRLSEMAIKDPLTGTYNRRYFDETLKNEVVSARKHSFDIVLMMIGIDHFKTINDKYGYDEGDRILAKLASLLRENLFEDDIISRYGGDEFAIIFHDTQVDAVCSTAKRLADLFAKSFENDNYADINLELSIGVSSTKNSQNANDLFNNTMEALCLARKKSSNKIESK